MSTRDLIIYVCLTIFVLYVTKVNHLWGNKKAVKKSRQDSYNAKSYAFWKDKYTKLLKLFETFSHIGFEPSLGAVEDMNFRIIRMMSPMKYVDRTIKPLELIGVFKLIDFIGTFIAVFGYFATYNPLFLSGFACYILKPAFIFYADDVIRTEDKEIERDFPDLFLLLYSRLINGAHIRLAPTLNDYLASLDALHNQQDKKSIRKLVMDLRNNIEIYGDDSMAVRQLREKFRGAMVVNFCNLAVQALSGVDNKDKLTAFKSELSQRQLEAMKLEAQKRVEKGQRVIMLVFVILGEFVVLSWMAKLGGSMGSLGSITSILGL